VIPVAVRRREHEPIEGTRYDPTLVSLLLQLVIDAGVSLRGASRVLETINHAMHLALPVPCWTTVRLWLMRLGHAMLTEELAESDDWAWLVDHSVQIGQEKCLVILGIRLCDLPERGESLGHHDMELIALVPAKSWTRPQVCEALVEAMRRTGHPPRVIVSDHGTDLIGGIALFRQEYPQTMEIYDAKHKAACMLKNRLEKNARWQQFQARIGQTLCAVQQTELAFLKPPGSQPKARFMNLESQLAWARKVQAILRDPPPQILEMITPQRLQEKFGWMRAFEDEVIEWSQWQQVADVSVKWISRQGIYPGVARELSRQLSHLDALKPSGKQLSREMVQFVRSEQCKTKPNERFPGSTEVLESCFGKFKQLEKQHCRGGFTQLLLGFGAMLTKITPTLVREALQATRTIDVKTWAAETLGVTVNAARKRLLVSATEVG
jgi:hypothetical protein